MKLAMKSALGLLLSGATLLSSSAEAAYTRTQSAPVTVTQIYANEMGSPFVWFSAAVNSACSGGGQGLYLDDITVSQPNVQLESAKLALLLSAEAQGKQVILDFYYDPTIVNSWSSCYIEGVYLVN